MPEKICSHFPISHFTIHPLCSTLPTWRKVANVALIAFTLIGCTLVYVGYRACQYVLKNTGASSLREGIKKMAGAFKQPQLAISKKQIIESVAKFISTTASQAGASEQNITTIYFNDLLNRISEGTWVDKAVATSAVRLLEFYLAFGQSDLAGIKRFATFYHAFRQAAVVEPADNGSRYKFTIPTETPESHTSQFYNEESVHHEARFIFNLFIDGISKDIPGVTALLNDPLLQKDENRSTYSRPCLENFEIQAIDLPLSTPQLKKILSSEGRITETLDNALQKSFEFACGNNLPILDVIIRLKSYSDFLLEELYTKILKKDPPTLGNKNVAQDAYHLLGILFSLGHQTLKRFKIGKETIETLVSNSQAFVDYYHHFQQGAELKKSEVYTFTTPVSSSNKPDMSDPLCRDAKILFDAFIGQLSEQKHPEIDKLLRTSSSTPLTPSETGTSSSTASTQPKSVEELVEVLDNRMNSKYESASPTIPYFKSENPDYKHPTTDKIHFAGHTYKQIKSNFEETLNDAPLVPSPWEQDEISKNACEVIPHAFILAKWALDDIKGFQAKHNLNDERLKKLILTPKECYILSTLIEFVTFYHTFRQAADFTRGTSPKFSTPKEIPTNHANKFYDKATAHYTTRLFFNHLIDHFTRVFPIEVLLKHPKFQKDIDAASYKPPKL